jgi:hypothetical protein
MQTRRRQSTDRLTPASSTPSLASPITDDVVVDSTDDDAHTSQNDDAWPVLHAYDTQLPASVSMLPEGFNRVNMIASMKSFAFKCFDYTPDQLLYLTLWIFDSEGVLVQLETDTMCRFLALVRANYRDVPYHNIYHAFSVMQFAYLLLHSASMHEFIDKMDVLALLIGSLCHDVDHPGNNNMYEIHAHTELAQRYNDISVLENHHIGTTFQLLETTQCLAPIKAQSMKLWRRMRTRIIQGILSTDMARHAELCVQMDAHIAVVSPVQTPITPRGSTLSMSTGSRGSSRISDGDGVDRDSPPASREASFIDEALAPGAADGAVPLFNRGDDQHRQLLFNILMHCADLHSVVVPTHISRVWGQKVTEEFASQAECEEAEGLPVASFMRNLRGNNHNTAMNQIGFIDFICTPLYAKLVQLFPSLAMCLDHLASNKQYYVQLKDQPSSPGTKSADQPRELPPANDALDAAL